MICKDIQLRVGYKDTDRMGIVHHSNYIVYYEMARTEFMRQLGLSYSECERQGIMMPILEVQSKYIASAYYDQILTVRVKLEQMPMARITFTYEIFDPDGKLLNTGLTVLGFLHEDTRRPCRVPEALAEVLRSHGLE